MINGNQIGRVYEGTGSTLKVLSLDQFLVSVTDKESDSGRGYLFEGGMSRKAHYFFQIYDAQDKVRVSAKLPPKRLATILVKLRRLVEEEMFRDLTEMDKRPIFTGPIRYYDDQRDSRGYNGCYQLSITYERGFITFIITNFYAPILTKGTFREPDMQRADGVVTKTVTASVDTFFEEFVTAYEIKRDFQTTHFVGAASKAGME